MRIFERLRRRSRSDKVIVRRIFETVTSDLLQKLEEGTSVPILADGASTCCSCCAARDATRR